MKVRDDHWNVFILHDVDKITSKIINTACLSLQDCIQWLKARPLLQFTGQPDDSEIRNYRHGIEQYMLITFDIQTHLIVVTLMFCSAGIKHWVITDGKVETLLVETNKSLLYSIATKTDVYNLSMSTKPWRLLPLSMISENQLRLWNCDV